jgi:hypothetical protein
MVVIDDFFRDFF